MRMRMRRGFWILHGSFSRHDLSCPDYLWNTATNSSSQRKWENKAEGGCQCLCAVVHWQPVRSEGGPCWRRCLFTLTWSPDHCDLTLLGCPTELPHQMWWWAWMSHHGTPLLSPSLTPPSVCLTRVRAHTHFLSFTFSHTVSVYVSDHMTTIFAKCVLYMATVLL